MRLAVPVRLDVTPLYRLLLVRTWSHVLTKLHAMTVAGFGDDDFDPRMFAELPGVRALNEQMARALAPQMRALSEQMGHALAPLIRAMQDLGRLTIPVWPPEVTEQLSKAVAGVTLSPEVLRALEDLGRVAKRAGDIPKPIKAVREPFPHSSAGLTGRGRTSPVMETALHAMTQTPGPPPEAELLAEMMRLSDPDIIERAASDVLNIPELRQAIEPLAEQLPAGDERQAVNKAWHLAMGLVWGTCVTTPIAVATDLNLHPILDSAWTSMSVALALTALYFGFGRSKD